MSDNKPPPPSATKPPPKRPTPPEPVRVIRMEVPTFDRRTPRPRPSQD